MKKTVALFLALILLLGSLSGLSFAAEAQVETITLRPGKIAEVDSAGDFMDAYQAMYEPNSSINGIRLLSDFTVYQKALRTDTTKNDPWMSGFLNSLVVRMPEGTVLDLNGCTLAMRANQGYDDNGTGKESGLVTIGTVIDSFGGGSLNLYTITQPQYLNRAFELARMYPGIVKTVSISEPLEGADDYEFTVPANVCLKFSGKASALKCKSVTFEPGATILVANETAPGLEGTEKIIFQYCSSADKRRAGAIEATETVEVPAPEAPAAKEYKVISPELSEEAAAAAYPKPAVIEKPTDKTEEAAVIKNPTGVKVTLKDSYTLKEMQDIVVDTGAAYYYQNPYVQYDGRSVAKCGLSRHDDHGAPEAAAVDSPVYSVCSGYCYKNYENAFDYLLFGLSYARTRTWGAIETELDEYEKYKDYLVYQYVGPYGQNTGAHEGKVLHGETDLDKALKESIKVIQPGDVIVGITETGGHAMMCVGDFEGDGVNRLMHCWGSSYDMDTGADPIEAGGSIKYQTVEECCYKEGNSPNWYLGSTGHSDWGFAILRPFNDPNFPKQPTLSGASRLQFPRMEIDRVLDRTTFESALPGDEIPVYLTITNHGKSEYTELPVEEYVPEGQTLVEGSVTEGAQIEGNVIRWAVKIPAGKSINLTYKVKLNAKLGDTVVFKAGKVAEIPSRETTLVIGGKTLTADQKDAIVAYAQKIGGTKTGAGQDLDAVNKFYAKALGVGLGLPKTVDEFMKSVVTTNSNNYVLFKSKLTGDAENWARMILPLHLSGQMVYNPTNWDRVREYRTFNYQPGDIFVTLKGEKNVSRVKDPSQVGIYIYMGAGHVLSYSKEGAKIDRFTSTFGNALAANVSFALRPSLAYEDLNTRAADDSLPFTDVSKADWFFTYVSDLVDDGTVNGMTPTTFVPKGELTFGQALKLIALTAGEKEPEPTEGEHWAYGYQRIAIRNKWMDSTVDLNAKITRLQFCQIAAKAMGLTEQPASNPFTDCDDPAVLALNKAGVIDGMEEKTFAPNKLLTRAQISKIIWCLRNVNK